MTREKMWEEFESQLKREVRTPITMSYDDSIRIAEMGIKDVVKRWKKRLEQEPCEDAISRKQAIRTIEKFCSSECVQVCVLTELPPVTPQPKIGHWIVQPSNEKKGERPYIWWKCSNCGQVIFSETEHDRLEFHAFCGRCGAKMIEPQERSGEE